jgi:RimJ/RimL family protein N-acetyltransferase
MTRTKWIWFGKMLTLVLINFLDMIKLEKFDKADYSRLISWIDNEEMLMQVGGPSLSFPLTTEQLEQSMEDKNRLAFTVIEEGTNEKIGHCEIYLTDTTAKLGRIIVGDKRHRGKGFGKQIVSALVEFVFTHLDRTTIELNVFDWNTNAIKCYENVGFRVNPGKTLERSVNGKTWIALNMIYDKGGKI